MNLNMSPDKSLSMLIDSITETTSSSEPIHDWLLINDFNEEDLGFIQINIPMLVIN